jgi:ABC-type transporter Mla subunit MlaD
VFLFLVLAGVGGAFAWRYYHFYNEIERLEKDNARITADGGQATDMIKQQLKSIASGFAEVQQQLKSNASDLAAVRNTLEQQSAANHDQLTRIQEQISRQSIALLSSSFLADKPVRTPPPKPAQHPPHVSTQDSSKPIQVARPLPPKQ